MATPKTTPLSRSPRRRTLVALSIILIVLVAFVIRLVDIQVVSAREHVDESLSMGLQSSRIEYGSRGSIVDEGRAVVRRAVVSGRLNATATLLGAKGRIVLTAQQRCGSRGGTWREAPGWLRSTERPRRGGGRAGVG